MDLKDMLMKDVLPAIGMKPKTPVAPMIGAFGVGMIIGYGIKYLMESDNAQRIYEDASRKLKDAFSSQSTSESREQRGETRRAS